MTIPALLRLALYEKMRAMNGVFLNVEGIMSVIFRYRCYAVAAFGNINSNRLRG